MSRLAPRWPDRFILTWSNTAALSGLSGVESDKGSASALRYKDLHSASPNCLVARSGQQILSGYDLGLLVETLV